MGITYQTSNRLRRKVMTAPLTLPAETAPVEAALPAPAVRSSRTLWWSATAASAVAIAAVIASKAF